MRHLPASVFFASVGWQGDTWQFLFSVHLSHVSTLRYASAPHAAGAMLCLLTSATCHLFGCCAAHITSVMWRFDYAGIAGGRPGWQRTGWLSCLPAQPPAQPPAHRCRLRLPIQPIHPACIWPHCCFLAFHPHPPLTRTLQSSSWPLSSHPSTLASCATPGCASST